jgi:hypothetical protein
VKFPSQQRYSPKGLIADKSMVQRFLADDLDFLPVSLNENMLESLGFHLIQQQKDTPKIYGHPVWIIQGLPYQFVVVVSADGMVRYDYKSNGYHHNLLLPFVHSLQELFYCMTREHLSVSKALINGEE